MKLEFLILAYILFNLAIDIILYSASGSSGNFQNIPIGALASGVCIGAWCIGLYKAGYNVNYMYNLRSFIHWYTADKEVSGLSIRYMHANYR